MNKRDLSLLLAPALFFAATAASVASANSEIIRPFATTRSEGMGGVTYATGLYDENFFGNPARVTANPDWRITLMDPQLEFSKNVPSTISSLTGGGDKIYTGIGNNSGQNNHIRLDTSMPAWYFSRGKWFYGLGLLTSSQANVDLHRNYSIDPQAIFDIGPAATVGRKFLGEDELSVGMTTHLMYRVASNNVYSVIDVIRGNSFGVSSIGGQGAMLDFDTGATYTYHWHPWSMNLQNGVAINNILGGRYANIGFHPISSITSKPAEQSRTFNIAASATKPTLGVFKNTVLALDVQDVGNNTDGSFYRLLHIGAESHLGILIGRLGLNQGYYTAGLGLDLKHFTIDFATYAEELGLNAGDYEDRRYAIEIAFQI